jgi:hypothetical protein
LWLWRVCTVIYILWPWSLLLDLPGAWDCTRELLSIVHQMLVQEQIGPNTPSFGLCLHK